jgi:hypothetical protein
LAEGTRARSPLEPAPGPRSQVTQGDRGRDSKRDSASRSRPSISPWHIHRPLAAHRGQKKKMLSPPYRPDSAHHQAACSRAGRTRTRTSPRPRSPACRVHPLGAALSPAQPRPGQARPSDPKSLAPPDRPGPRRGPDFGTQESPPRALPGRAPNPYTIYTLQIVFFRALRAHVNKSYNQTRPLRGPSSIKRT